MEQRSDISRLLSATGGSGLRFQEIREQSRVEEARDRWPLLKNGGAAFEASGAVNGAQPSAGLQRVVSAPLREPARPSEGGMFSRLMEQQPAAAPAAMPERRGEGRPWSGRSTAGNSTALQDVFARLLEAGGTARAPVTGLRRLVR